MPEHWFAAWRCECSDVQHDPADIPDRCPHHDTELITRPERLDGPPISGTGHQCPDTTEETTDA